MGIFEVLEKNVHKADMVQNSKHCAAITYKNKIVCIGFNKRKTHPKMLEYGSRPERLYLHAEIDSILKTVNQFGEEFLKECELYVLRLSKGGSISMSKPCEGCDKAIKAFGIKKVYWTK